MASTIHCMHPISIFPYETGTHCHRKRGHRGDHMEYSNRVQTKQGTITTHSEEACDYEDACVIHSPSGHKMRGWPLVLRADKSALIERVCTHGVGHPDPDSVTYFIRNRGNRAEYLWLHGCDGCCATISLTEEA